MTVLWMLGQILGMAGFALKGWAGWQTGRRETLIWMAAGSALLVGGNLLSGLWGIAAMGVVSTTRNAVYAANRGWPRKVTIPLGILFAAASSGMYMLVEGVDGGPEHWLPVAAVLVIAFFQISMNALTVKLAGFASGVLWCGAYTVGGAYGMLAGEAVDALVTGIAAARIWKRRRTHTTA